MQFSRFFGIVQIQPDVAILQVFDLLNLAFCPYVWILDIPDYQFWIWLKNWNEVVDKEFLTYWTHTGQNFELGDTVIF